MDDGFDFNFDSFYDEAKESDPKDHKSLNPAFQTLCEQEYKYVELGLLGTGGMKRVARVYDNFTRREVALATLHEDASDELIDHFIYEAWLTAQLDHPGIIKIHELSISDDDRPYFTMDLKKGSSLKEVLNSYSEEVGINERLDIFLKVCNAINYAHSKNILHLDLKPDNIQIGKYGEAIVCDWGLAQMTNSYETTSLNFDQEFLNAELVLKAGRENKHRQGTPGYMSPEQINKDKALSPLSDVYGLGALLYFMLTLQAPTSGKLHEIFDKTLAGEIIPPQEINPKDVSNSLNAIIMKAMATEQSQRYQTVEGLRRDIYQYMLGFSPSAENASFSKEFRLFCLRNKAFIRIFTAFILVLFTILAVLIFRKIS